MRKKYERYPQILFFIFPPHFINPLFSKNRWNVRLLDTIHSYFWTKILPSNKYFFVEKNVEKYFLTFCKR